MLSKSSEFSFAGYCIIDACMFCDKYSKTCIKRPLSKRPKMVFQDHLSFNAGQKHCRMEHSAMLSAFIKLPFVIKIYVLSTFEWLFYCTKSRVGSSIDHICVK